MFNQLNRNGGAKRVPKVARYGKRPCVHYRGHIIQRNLQCWRLHIPYLHFREGARSASAESFSIFLRPQWRFRTTPDGCSQKAPKGLAASKLYCPPTHVPSTPPEPPSKETQMSGRCNAMGMVMTAPDGMCRGLLLS